MKRRLPNHTARLARLLTLALAVLLLCAGGLALDQAGAGASVSQDSGVVTHHAGSDGSDGLHLPSVVETPDSEETYPAGSEHLNTLVLGLFLVSLGLLLGAGLFGRASERRLLELLRLPSITPLSPARLPVSALEVFRL